MNSSRNLWLLTAFVEAVAIALLAWLLMRDVRAEVTPGSESPGALESSSSDTQPAAAPVVASPSDTASNAANNATNDATPVAASDGVAPEALPLGTLVYGTLLVPEGSPDPNSARLSLTVVGEVKAQRQEYLSGDDLSFAWPDVAAGDYELRVAAESMRDVTQAITIPEGATAHRVDLTLEPKWIVNVLLRTPSGRNYLDALPEFVIANPSLQEVDWSGGLEVIALWQEIPAELPSTDLRTTSITIANWNVSYGGRRGASTEQLATRYAGVLELPERRACFTALVLKEVVLARAPLAAGQTELELIIDLEQMVAALATVRCKIVDASGQPLSQAKVGVDGAQGWSQPRAVDASGQFELGNLVPGLFRLSVTCEGHAIAPYNVTLRPGATTDLGTLTLQPFRQVQFRPVGAADPAEVRGFLTALDRVPHASLQPSAEQLAVRDGLITTNLVPGRYRLQLSGSGGASIDFDLRSLTETPLAVVLQPEASITFDPGQLSGPARLIVNSANGMQVINRWITWRSKWQQLVLPGSYSITVANVQGQTRTQQLVVTVDGASFTL